MNFIKKFLGINKLSKNEIESEKALLSKPDITKAIKDSREIFDLGSKYYSGDGIPQNYSQAKKYFHTAADQGNPLAQHMIGFLYEKGYGIPLDYKEAFKWYKLAAVGQTVYNAPSRFAIGVFYRDGLGVTRDYFEAAKWIRSAAELGSDTAQYNLALMYYWGHGVTENITEAIKWCQSAADLGNSDAKTNLLVFKNKRGY